MYRREWGNIATVSRGFFLGRNLDPQPLPVRIDRDRLDMPAPPSAALKFPERMTAFGNPDKPLGLQTTAFSPAAKLIARQACDPHREKPFSEPLTRLNSQTPDW